MYLLWAVRASPDCGPGTSGRLGRRLYFREYDKVECSSACHLIRAVGCVWLGTGDVVLDRQIAGVRSVSALRTSSGANSNG